MKRKHLSESLLLDVEDLHPDGYGVARHAERSVAVLGALPGERVTARTIRRRGKVTYSRTETVLVRSDVRVDPACPHSDRCAGCSMQHLANAAQIRFKQRLLEAELGDLVPDRWLEPVTGPVTAYRSKARLGVKYVEKKGRVLVGFREKVSPYIAEVDGCPVLVESLGTLLPALAELIGGLECKRAIPQIEVAAGDAQAALVFRHLTEISPEDLERLTEFGAQTGLHIYLQPGGLESAHRIMPLDVPERLFYRLPLQRIEMAFHPLDFTQVNLKANRAMVTRALDLLDPGRQDRVLDLFCGIGNLTLPLARRAYEVMGVEGAASAVARARENAEANGIANVSFRCADLYASDQIADAVAGEWQGIVIDPPRSGAEALCNALTGAAARKILYISCNPATLARDGKVLETGGFRLACAGIVDMFPHTSHVESMAVFERHGG